MADKATLRHAVVKQGLPEDCGVASGVEAPKRVNSMRLVRQSRFKTSSDSSSTPRPRYLPIQTSQLTYLTTLHKTITMVRTVFVSAARIAQRRAVRHTKLRQMDKILFAGAPAQTTRAFAHSAISWKGLMPESSDPAPRTVQPDENADAPAELTMAQYHEAADNYIEQLVQAFEALAEADAMVDVEYSVSPCGKASPILHSQQ